MNQEKDYKFYVIELLEHPYTNPDRYVCIPFSWIRFRETTDGGALVKFPTEELSETKKRVKKQEEFSNDWLIFSADIKYSTDSYHDANDYIEILNKISIQEQNRTKVFKEDMPSTSGMNMFKSLPSLEQIESTNPEVEVCQEKTKLEGATNFATKAKRYSTRQSIRMSSPTGTINSLDQPAKKSFHEARDFIKESEKVKNDEETDEPSVENNQYRQLTNEWQVKKILQSVFGDDFIKELKKIHSEFKMSYLKVDAVRLSLLKTCESIEGLIQLAGKVSNDSDSGDLNPAVEELENDMIKMNLNKNTIVNDDEAGSEIQNNTLKEKKKQINNSDNDITDEDENYEDKINNPLDKIRGQARKFTLPPEYDPDDSKWTLKHRKKRKDLVELTPHSGVYVDAIKLSNCKRVSSDSKTFARMLLLEIFSESALSVCSLTGKKANAFDLEGTSVRPGLDEHARTVLLNYVDQYAHEQKWVKLDLHTILNSLRNKIQECRGKNG